MATFRPALNRPFVRKYPLPTGFGADVLNENDVVFVDTIGQVGLALASNVDRMPAVGVVLRITGGEAVVARYGFIKVVTPLVRGKRYLVSDTVLGGIKIEDDLPVGASIQYVGRASSETRLEVDVEEEPIEYLG